MAIAFDAGSANTALNASSITVSHTCAASAVLVVWFAWNNNASRSLSSLTYNSVAMTQVGSTLDITLGDASNAPGKLVCYKIDNPASGAHNIVATLSAATGANEELIIQGMSFTGHDTASPIGASGSLAQFSNIPQAITFSSNRDNSYAAIGIAYGSQILNTTGYTVSNSSNSRPPYQWTGYKALGAAGSNNPSVNGTGNPQDASAIVVEIQAISAGASAFPRLALMGVGR